MKCVRPYIDNLALLLPVVFILELGMPKGAKCLNVFFFFFCKTKIDHFTYHLLTGGPWFRQRFALVLAASI